MGNFILQLSRLSNLFSDVLDLPLRDRLKMNKKVGEETRRERKEQEEILPVQIGLITTCQTVTTV